MPAMSKIVLGVCAVEALNSQNLLSSKNRMEIQQHQVAGDSDVSKLFQDLKITYSIPLDEAHPACAKISDGFEYYLAEIGTQPAFFKDTPELEAFHKFTKDQNPDTFSDQKSYATEVLTNSSDTALERKILDAGVVFQNVLKEVFIKSTDQEYGLVLHDQQHVLHGAPKKRLDCMIEGMRAFDKEVVDKLPGQAAKDFYKGLWKGIEDNVALWLAKIAAHVH